MKPGSIVGGSEATAFSLPWQVALVFPTWTTHPHGPDKPWCGGTLIGPQHVLTAAHCMGGSFDVLVGEHNASDEERIMKDRNQYGEWRGMGPSSYLGPRLAVRDGRGSYIMSTGMLISVPFTDTLTRHDDTMTF